MRTANRLSWTVVLALVAAPGLRAQEAVTLDFAWPPGSALVTVSTASTAGAGGQTATFDTGMSYRLTVAGDDGGLRVSYADFTFDGAAMEELLSGEAGGEEMSRAMSGMQPDILVSSGGRFVGLADYAGLRASMEELMEPMIAEMEAQGMAGMMRDMMEATLSEEAMSRNAEMGWNQMAGFWAGRTMREGEPVTVSSEIVLPMLATQPVVMDTELRLVGRVACREGAPSRGCLELASIALPDPEELRNLMDIFMAEMVERAGGTGMEMGITELAMRMASTLVVEAESLLPLRMESTVEMTMGMDVMGNTQTMSNRQLVTTRFDWGS